MNQDPGIGDGCDIDGGDGGDLEDRGGGEDILAGGRPGQSKVIQEASKFVFFKRLSFRMAFRGLASVTNQ